MTLGSGVLSSFADSSSEGETASSCCVDDAVLPETVLRTAVEAIFSTRIWVVTASPHAHRLNWRFPSVFLLCDEQRRAREREEVTRSASATRAATRLCWRTHEELIVEASGKGSRWASLSFMLG